MLLDKVKFTIKGKKAVLLDKTEKVVSNGKKHDCYNINGLFTTFISLGYKCTYQEFLNGIKENPDLIVAGETTRKGKGLILVAEKTKMSKNALQEILNKVSQSKSSSGDKKQTEVQSFLNSSSTVSKRSLTSSPKVNIKESTSTTLANNTTAKITNSTGITNQNTANKNTNTNLTIPPVKLTPVPGLKKKDGIKAQIDFDSDDMSDSYESNINHFKTPLQSPKSVNNSINKGFEAVKMKIEKAFGDGLVISNATFSTTYSNANGMMFNYRTQQCKLPNHKHGNMKKFLGCCTEVVETRKLYEDFVFLKTDYAREVVKRRFIMFDVPSSHPRFSIYLEVLIVNLFPVKISICLKDLIEIFEIIYKRKLERMINGSIPCTKSSDPTPMAFSDFVFRLASPNITLTNNNDVIKVTLIPTTAPTYRPWYGESIFKEILEAERAIRVGDNQFEPVRVNLPAVEVFKGVSGDISTNESSSSQISTLITDLLTIADMNIPKSVQKQRILKNSIKMERTNIWKYLKHNVNFDDESTFRK